ncbi:paraplegin [Cephus cinctus]|uniref:Paraplegin n=1 Tax=Cephus cinctus TaxID=211228 RepID=A0AAJ7BHR7_CEPCN|nr:paraplegin [Cephus cinctus]
MQNLATCSNRHLLAPGNIFRLLLNCGTHARTAIQHRALLSRGLKYLRNGPAHKLIHPVSYHAYKQFHREYRAVCSLLQRSGFGIVTEFSKITGQRSFSTPANKPKNPSNAEKSAKGTPENDSENDKKKKENEEKLKALFIKLSMWTLFMYITIAFLMFFIGSNRQNVEGSKFVSWNEFLYHMLAKGEVEELIVRPEYDVVTIVLYDGAVIKGKRSKSKIYHMIVSDVVNFEEKLREAERSLGIKPDQYVQIVYERKKELLAQLVLYLIALGVVITVLMRSRGLRGPIDFLGQMTRAKFTLVDPLTGSGKGVHFEDVAGLKEAKIEVMEFVDYLKHPEHYKSLGAKVPKGALLLGPPGCGKTLLAKAVATESNVPFLSMNGSEFIEMIGGLGAARVRDLFKEAKKRSPCIIYIDEIDAIGKKRSGTISGPMDGSSGESEQTLNQLLVEMDGMASKEGVILLASTNRAEVLDKALLRPGRFDRHILIDLPTLEERKQIFERHLKGIALKQKPEFYSYRLAYLTPGFSGADIANVCNEAALHAARYKKKVVDSSDLSYAVDRMVGGTEKRDHAMSPAEKRIVAYHEAGHALVGWLLEHTDALLKVTIVPRTNLALGFAQYIPTDQKLYSQEQLFERMCMALGGRVSESLTFNKITTGAQNDLQKVTKMAYSQVQQFGMNENVGLLSFDEEVTNAKNKKPYSKRLGNLMDGEARRLVGKAYRRTEQLLQENKDKLQLLAETLLKKETLNYEDVVNLIGPPPFKNKKFVEPADFESSILEQEPPAEQPTTV